ncbi:MAG: hypothetical protein EOP76_07710 [Variovorax sp.]|nr:MAG: hypothetical protein EOP76_07710 [Variovorax sp.]
MPSSGWTAWEASSRPNSSPPGCAALRVRYAHPLPGAAPAARRSRFRGTPRKYRPFVLLLA